MKYMTTVVLMLTLGAASVYAQETPINVTLSGTGAPGTVDLGTGTGVSEYSLAGKGTPGPFTLRVFSAGAAAPQPSSTCSGIYIPVLAGKGVFRFQDGSLLKLKLTSGSDCINPAAGEALCTRIFQITGGTGRFEGASGGPVTLTMTVTAVVPNEYNFFTVTGNVTGAISGVAGEEVPQDDGH